MKLSKPRPATLLALCTALICITLQLGGLEPVFRYDRELIAEGNWWLLLTGNFVHLGISHLILNMTGLALIVSLVWVNFSARQWLLILIVSSLAVGGGLFLLDPQLLWYVGLSGSLHGLLVAGALGDLRRYPWQAILLLLVVGAKLAYEQMYGAVPGSESAAGGAVVVNAHFYGAIAGAITGALLLLLDRFRQHPPQAIP